MERRKSILWLFDMVRKSMNNCLWCSMILNIHKTYFFDSLNNSVKKMTSHESITLQLETCNLK